MSRQFAIAYFAEGSTDIAFLQNILERSANYLINEYRIKDAELLAVFPLNPEKGEFVKEGLDACCKAFKSGAEILCVHVDADAPDNRNVISNKINPLRAAVAKETNNQYCQNIVPIIPVQMIESWMMANKAELLRQMGTDKTEKELGLEKRPEQYADPKQAIIDAIGEVKKDEAKRRRNKLSINNLYAPLGNNLELVDLMTIPSFAKFMDDLHMALSELHICH